MARFALVSLLVLNVFSSAALASPRSFDSIPSIFSRRDSDCIDMTKCPTPEPCNCAKGLSCQLTLPSCTECGKNVCMVVDDEDVNPGGVSKDEKSDTNIGAIAGGAIGGLALIGVAVFFWLRSKKRKQQTEEVRYVDDDAMSETEKSEGFGMLKEARASVQTVATMASNVSNFIQITYIPGVTSRSHPSTPNGLVPPVPPIPFGHRDSTASGQIRYPQSPASDEVFYLYPSGRNSTFSAAGDRSSVATTIYGVGNAVVAPVQAKAAVVQVKSTNNTPAATPEIEQGNIPSIPGMAPRTRRTVVGARSPLANSSEPNSPAFSVGTTFMMNQMLDKQRQEDQEISDLERLRQQGSNSNIPTESDWAASDEETMSTTKPRSYAQHRQTQSSYLTATTDIETGSPFSDRHSIVEDYPLPAGTGMPPASIHSGHSRVSSPALSQRTLMLHSPREARSPFDDSHEGR